MRLTMGVSRVSNTHKPDVADDFIGIGGKLHNADDDETYGQDVVEEHNYPGRWREVLEAEGGLPEWRDIVRPDDNDGAPDGSDT
jgi:hypothetical protein